MPLTPRPSAVETAILELLVPTCEMYGLEMVHGSDRLKKGTIYVTLGRMLDKGLLTSRTVTPPHTPGGKRRLYRATALGTRMFFAGRAADKAWQTRMAR